MAAHADGARRNKPPRARGKLPRAPALLLVTTIAQRRIVAACCSLALRSGVRPGMTLSDAAGRLHNPTIAEWRRDQDAVALRAIACWAEQFSPMVGPDGLDGLLADVSGCGAVFGGEGALARRIVRSAARLGLTARCAIAPTLGAAWALARHGQDATRVLDEKADPNDSVRAALAGLPLEALRIDAPACDALREVGIERVGELVAMPRSLLPSRFGALLLLRMDQAFGGAIETFAPIRARAPIRVRRAFDGPTTSIEGLLACAKELVHELCERLHTLQRGVTLLEVRLSRTDLGDGIASVSCSMATRDARHLWALVRPAMERAHLGLGVEAIEMTPIRTRPIPHQQASHWIDEHPQRPDGEASHERARALGELVDALAGRLGADRVRVAALVGSHVPERAAVFTSVGALPNIVETLSQDGRTRDVPSHAPAADTHVALPHDRPPLLFTHACPARVVALTPDGPVHALSWAGGEGDVVACLGPERIAGEWWRGEAWTREYFKVQDASGRWLWLFREVCTGAWFVQGEW